ncbi:ABC transporter ATP-binding protein [Halococcus saccharolyticus]|uniref:ABC-type multidrug transport system, ATPase component n=1 Tax=Halococcus saccharolyticus DSM 5350 TaxID=1227455 RepID=M0MHL3_9EURY|nr:ABC transporter ATP-binding protein [Halococcus saccharolyticus]EMA44189.1 ABC-type multidrug transport system, ATPase component [Halococcus saccharolyticus DSM 5350]
MSTNAPLERENARDRTAEESNESSRSVVSVDGLGKTYGDGDDAVRAVEDVSFDIEPGTVVGLLGPNGAGKTTTIKAMLGLVVPTTGTVTIDGVNVHEEPRAAYQRVGAMLEGARNVYWKLTVRENLEFFAALSGRRPAAVADRHDRLLDQLALTEKADVPVNDLSRGMKQKVSLACTLARDASVAFLDEPTLGLDVESSLELRRELRRLAEQESMTVVLSSHDMDVVQAVCDRVIIMNDGRVVTDDTVDGLIDLFRSQAYHITVDDLPEGVRDRLAAEFDVDGFEAVGDRTRFAVSLPDGRALYDVMDTLREADTVPESVDSIEPDLEDVFLELTGGENG